MKLKLTGDWVLVEPVSRVRITKAGIHMPEGMQHLEPHYGRVLEIGPGKLTEYNTRLHMSAKPGDMVFYSSLHAYPILYHGEGHFLLHDYEVFAIVEDEEDGQKLRETLIADVSKTNSDAECPEHGKTCAPWYAISDGNKGLYCPTSHKFYPEEELKGE